MNDVPMVITWHGKRLTDMTKEELIEAVVFLNGELQEHYASENIRAREWGER